MKALLQRSKSWHKFSLLAALLCSACTVPAQDGHPIPPAPPAARPLQIVVIGDSLSTGYGTSPDLAWPAQIQHDAAVGSHPVSVINASVNGSGYVAQGDGGATFSTEVNRAVQAQTNVVLLFGSENDMGTDGSQLKDAAAQTLAAAKARAPKARIVVVGPPAYTYSPEQSRLQVRDQDRSAALEAGAVFVDPIDEQWVMAQASELIGPDGDHPSVQGQTYLKQKMEEVLESAMS